MLDSFIMQIVSNEQLATSAWNLIDSLLVGFMIISTIGTTIALRLRKQLQNSKSETAKSIVKVINELVLPIFDTGEKIVTSTRDQQQQIKELTEVLFDFMGPQANEIKDKIYIQMETLKKQVDKGNITAEEYRNRLEKIINIVDELKIELDTDEVNDLLPLEKSLKEKQVKFNQSPI